jgi:hypothetical protein
LAFPPVVLLGVGFGAAFYKSWERDPERSRYVLLGRRIWIGLALLDLAAYSIWWNS